MLLFEFTMPLLLLYIALCMFICVYIGMCVYIFIIIRQNIFLLILCIVDSLRVGNYIFVCYSVFVRC